MEQEWNRGRFLNYFMGLVGALVFAIGIFTEEPLWDDLGAAGIGILGSAIGLHLFFFRIPKGRLNEEQKLKLERRQTVLHTTYFLIFVAMSICLCVAAFLPKEHPAGVIIIAGSVVSFIVLGVISIPESRAIAFMQKDQSLHDERQQSLFDKANRKGLYWMFFAALFCGAGHVVLDFTPPLWFAFYFPPLIGAAGIQWYMMRNV